MNKFIIGMIFTVSFSAFAQNASETIVDVTPQQQGQIQVVNEPVTTQTVNTNVEQTPVVIQNQPQIQVQKQATTIVEDSPLSESSADRLRRQRVELEQKVESQIVEKLEQDRIKSEQERLDKLFKQQEVVAQPQVEIQQNAIQNSNVVQDSQIIAPIQVVQPQEAISPVVDAKLDEPAVVESVVKIEEVKAEESSQDKIHMSFDFGFLNYTAADNIDSTGVIGVTVGQTFDDRFIVEGGFSFARSEIEAVNRPYVVGFGPFSTTYYTTITEMEQYNFNGTFKYKVLKGKFSPIVGGGLSYVYRDYEDIQYFDYKMTAESTAVDAAFIVGGLINLSEKMSITAEYRYSMNVFNDISLDDGRLQPSKMWGESLTDPVEEVGYSNFLIGLKYIF